MSGLVILSPDTCASCRFWLRNPMPADNGVCRRRSPAVLAATWVGQAGTVVSAGGKPPPSQFQVTNFVAVFPTMMRDGWCGDHESPKRPDS